MKASDSCKIQVIPKDTMFAMLATELCFVDDINRYSSFSSAVVRAKIELQKDRKFKARLESIKNNILKGQPKT